MKKMIFASAIAMASHPMFAETLTRETGAPVGDNQNSKTAGATGGTLLEDAHLLEKLARFDRERIPERVVHPRGVGAHGYFVSYDDFSDVTQASLLAKKNKKTEVFVRFSSVIHSKGSPETLRDPRGFAVKFYTDQGNWDLVGNNLPVFFIRDAMKFPDMVHSLKSDPVTNRQDPNRIFDFMAHHPESIHMWTHLFSNKGTPRTLRGMDGNGVHAYKFVNQDGMVQYVKFRWLSQQADKGLTAQEAATIQAKDFSHHTNDLYQAIQKKKFPSWELQALLMDPKNLDKFDFYPLDATKDWNCEMKLVTCKTLGKMTLNRVPENFFQYSEQSAFSPAVFVPGIEPSEDRLLQGRLFSYSDTQRYRLGVNYQYLPVNRAKTPIRTFNQDGVGATLVARDLSINYQPNSFDGSLKRDRGTLAENTEYRYSQSRLDGKTQQKMIAKTLNFRQAGELYRSYSDFDKKHLIMNFAGDLNQIRNKKVVEQMVAYAYAADIDYGTRLAKATKTKLSKVKKIAVQIQDDPKKTAASFNKIPVKQAAHR
ncbi:catalase [Pseudobacteriovorax antillogorgiicola]|uniref:Catalase n=1 Tax=Pseudobacteriovorax antillogorgiicola TaxID=1513793 RepID=A0A1Y6CJ96_9BACT|nr:catalase [Pseudobacteriovorax antillogorgiicola]TCS48274.1 catalase [Pseudobacteriovorax antillogorgiicola]SMF57068.1 catalase [Pseudobacteriovorax antillogorgiicola]